MNCVKLRTVKGTSGVVIVLSFNTNVTVCGSGTGYGLSHVML